MTKTEYLKIANDIKSFMDSKLVAPEYAYNTSLGYYLGYQNMIYIYSQILGYYSDNGVLPNNIAIEPWISVIIPDLGNVPAELLPYIQPTNNCQSNDPNITSLAYLLVSGASSVWDAGSNIFEWVRDNLAYSFYYNTQKGAVGTLNSMSGNCCDHTHLLIALARAVGIPAKYIHGDCTFSSGRYGHVWAQLYINGTWYDADATSSKNELGVINNWNTQTFNYKGTYRELPF
jgi:transglutaminase-like putative cysteine protease